MSFTVEPYPDGPIIVTNLHKDFDVSRELAFSDQATLELLAVAAEPQTLILIFDAALDIDALLTEASRVAREGDPVWRHAKVKQVLWVTEDAALHTAAKALDAAAFGDVPIGVYDSFDQALAVALAG